MPRKSIESFHFGTRLEVTRYWLVSIFHHINERDNCRLPISAHSIVFGNRAVHQPHNDFHRGKEFVLRKKEPTFLVAIPI